MKKNIEQVLKTILSSDQITALKEEISSGIKKVNSIVDKNEKIKAKKDLIVELINRFDNLIETSDKSPVILKTFYSAAKTNVRNFVQPILKSMVEEEDLTGLDDIPDVPHEKEADKVVSQTDEMSDNKKNEVKKPFKKNNRHPNRKTDRNTNKPDSQKTMKEKKL